MRGRVSPFRRRDLATSRRPRVHSRCCRTSPARSFAMLPHISRAFIRDAAAHLPRIHSRSRHTTDHRPLPMAARKRLPAPSLRLRSAPPPFAPRRPPCAVQAACSPVCSYAPRDYPRPSGRLFACLLLCPAGLPAAFRPPARPPPPSPPCVPWCLQSGATPCAPRDPPATRL